MKVMQELRRQEQSAIEAAKRDYRAVVRRLADGNDDPQLLEVQAVLAAVGKTAGDMTTDVALERSRNEHRAKIRAALEAAAERPGIEQQIKAADVELEEAGERHRRIVLPLRARLSEITQHTFEAADAKRRLRDLCDDEELTSALAGTRRDMQHLDRSIHDQQRLVDRIEALISTATNRASERFGGWQQQYGSGEPADAAQLQMRLGKAEQALAELRAQQADVVARQTQIVEQMST